MGKRSKTDHRKLLDMCCVAGALFTENARLLGVLSKIDKLAKNGKDEDMAKKAKEPTMDEIIECVRKVPAAVQPHLDMQADIIKALEAMRDEPEAPKEEEPPKAIASNDKAKKATA